ncbi:hypothetical protein AAHE18_20G259000 [Arachis hypogaea]
MEIGYQNVAACAVFVLVMVMAEIAGICANSSTTLHSPCLERERQALLKFKASLNDSSNMLSSWHGDDCCRWKGIGCDNVTGHVVMLDLTTPYVKCWRPMWEGEYWLTSDDEDNCYLLYQQYLEATDVNSSLLELEYLTHLDLTGNRFHWSPIPMFIGSMQRLSNINWISQLPLLEHLNMMESFIYNEYQVNIINLTITAPNLHFLSLAYNRLSVSNLDALQNMTSLVHLDFRGNNLTSVSSWFGNFKKLEYLDLSRCGLHGPIPNAFQNATSIEFLDLSRNHFDSLPSWFHKFEKLKHLFLSSNNFQGIIPPSLNQLVNLNRLDLSRNKLDGRICIDFQKLVNLSYLDLSSNNLNGPITVEESRLLVLSEMSDLNLSNNQISGSLPEHIGHIMPNLNDLILGNNLINGSIPKSLCQVDYLSILDLSKNRLSGKIPDCWKDKYVWEEINLSSNKLSGAVPSSFGNLSTLAWLHLNNNSLHGEFLASMRNLPHLLIMDLGENQLSGTISSWSANTFSSLQILRLRQNLLSGGIPSQICELSSLKILDLSRNNLNGSIPWCIGNLRGMTLEASTLSPPSTLAKGISFRRARVHDWETEDVVEVMKGRELDYIKILKLVVMMDLSENNLVGSIPKGITLLNGLHSLNLSNNHLIGKIPNMIRDMRSLESFDISSNQLSGTIPSSMSALTSLTHLNLSYNNFSGPIPTDNQFLTYDSSSYAGNPYLCGSPLPNKCGPHQVPGSSEFEDEDSKTDKLEKWLFYFVIAIGFATGFWGVIGTLWFKKTWRHAYFRWVEDLADSIYVTTAIRMAKLKKWMIKRNRVVV